MLKLTFVLSAFLCSCSNSNLLSYRIRPYFKERNTYQLDSTIFIRQAIRYDRPGWNDEEYSFGVIFFVDSFSLRNHVSLDLADTSVIRYYHSLPRQYHLYGTPYPYKLQGKLTLLKWSTKKIKLKEKIMVIDSVGKEMHTYHGRRTFKLDDTSTIRRIEF